MILRGYIFSMIFVCMDTFMVIVNLGLTCVFSFFSKNFRIKFFIIGILVDFFISIILFIFFFFRWVVFNIVFIGFNIFINKFLFNFLNLVFVMVFFICECLFNEWRKSFNVELLWWVILILICLIVNRKVCKFFLFVICKLNLVFSKFFT